MTPYLLIALIIVASAVIGIFYKSHTEIESAKSDAPLMMFFAMAPLAIISLIICLFDKFEMGPSVILTGLACSVFMLSAMTFLLKSMKSGSFTISIIIINLNFCVPIVLSHLFLNEKVSLFQLFGILLLVGVIIYTNLKGGNSEEATKQENTGSKRFLFYAVMACLSNGMSNFMIKLQQYYTPGKGENSFYLVMYGGAALICAVAFLITRYLHKPKDNTPMNTEMSAVGMKKELRLLLIGLGMGLCLAGCQYPQSFLPGYLNAPVQFTLIAAGAVLLSIAIGFVKYREKPNATNIISSICCILAIFLQLLN